MKIELVKNSVSLVDKFSDSVLRIERAARTCYQSEAREKGKLLANLIRDDHSSMLEFASYVFEAETCRGVSHELVRHRIGASYAQESTRYVNYEHKPIRLVIPVCFQREGAEHTKAYSIWHSSCIRSIETYIELRKEGLSPQNARGVLPMSLATRIAIKFNGQSLRHFFKKRLTGAHPDMEDFAKRMFITVQEAGDGPIFNDIKGV